MASRRSYQPIDVAAASAIGLAISNAASVVEADFVNSPHHLALLAPLCLVHSAAVLVHDFYCCPGGSHDEYERSRAKQEVDVQVHSVGELKRVASRIRDLCDQLFNHALFQEDDTAVSPFVLDSMYSAAATLHWVLREEGTLEIEDGMNLVKRTLARLSLRWRLAGEYLKLLEQVDIHLMLQFKGQ
jgi:hypothetical protein